MMQKSPSSFCTKSTATASPLVTIWNPTIGFANVCVGIVTNVQLDVTVTAVQVEPLSIVILMVPVPVILLTMPIDNAQMKRLRSLKDGPVSRRRCDTGGRITYTVRSRLILGSGYIYGYPQDLLNPIPQNNIRPRIFHQQSVASNASVSLPNYVSVPSAFLA